MKEGDRVPADACCSSTPDGRRVAADRESAPVRKRAARPGSVGAAGRRRSAVHLFGDAADRRAGVARVAATGANGNGQDRQGAADDRARAERAAARDAACGADLRRDRRRALRARSLLYGVARGDWLNGLLAGITLAMANLPEEFPVVLTVFMALGAWRISQKGVLTRRAPAIETLGATRCSASTRPGPSRRTAWRWAASGRAGKDRSLARRCTACATDRMLHAGERARAVRPDGAGVPRLARQRFPGVASKMASWTLVHSYPLTPKQLSVADSGSASGSVRSPPRARRRRSRTSARSMPRSAGASKRGRDDGGRRPARAGRCKGHGPAGTPAALLARIATRPEAALRRADRSR